MATKDTVSRIMANLRELHPELPERARVNLELDLRRMESAPNDVKEKETRPRSATATRRTPTPQTDRPIAFRALEKGRVRPLPRGEREPLGFADLRKWFNQGG
jgi:hypothetical protein